MGKKALLYSAGLIGVYLVVAYSTGSSRFVKAGTGGAVNVIKAFQGR